MSTAGFDKVLIVWQCFSVAEKHKTLKKIIKDIFEVEGVVTQKIIKSKRSGTPKLCWADEVKFEF